MHHIISGTSKTEALAAEAAKRRGRSEVIFFQRLDLVHEISSRLRADGHKGPTLTGAHNSVEENQFKLADRALSAAEKPPQHAARRRQIGRSRDHDIRRPIPQQDAPSRGCGKKR